MSAGENIKRKEKLKIKIKYVTTLKKGRTSLCIYLKREQHSSRCCYVSICTLRDIFNPSYVFFESMKFWSSSFFLKRIILKLWQDYILCVADDAKLEISLKIIYSFSFYKTDYNILFEKRQIIFRYRKT